MKGWKKYDMKKQKTFYFYFCLIMLLDDQLRLAICWYSNDYAFNSSEKIRFDFGIEEKTGN